LNDAPTAGAPAIPTGAFPAGIFERLKVFPAGAG